MNSFLKRFNVPHVFIFLSAIILFCSALTYIVPSGQFERTTRTVGLMEQTVVVPTSGVLMAMLGLAGWHTELGQRVGISVCLFVLAFAIVGQEFNQYWGLMISPLFCFGVVRFPASVRDLWTAAKPTGCVQRRVARA